MLKKRIRGAAPPKKTGRALLRTVAGCLCVAVAVWALLPTAANGIFGVGVVLPLGAALLGLWGVYSAPITKKGWRRKMGIALISAACAAAVAGAAITGVMLSAAAKEPPADGTVVVLGSKIHGDRPSRMLADRLRAAAAYLQENPAANCVVSGGLGKGETYTEAYVMQKYLTEVCGIDPARIACEDRSTDTRENLLFSMEIIEDRGWSRDLVTATQIFHQYRAQSWARRAGAEQVGSAACRTPAHLVLNYWVRECAAICRLWLAGR